MRRAVTFAGIFCAFIGGLQQGTATAYQISQQSNGWNFFRGDSFDGHAQEFQIETEWSEKGPPVIWRRELGVGYSSFVGNEHRVYTQYQTTYGQYVICLDSRTGETVWEYRCGWPYKPLSLYPGPRSTPTLDEDRLFFTTPNYLLGCLNAKTGDLIWQVDLASKFELKELEFGYACSPVCVGGNVVLPVGGTDASMVAFSKNDGSVVWQSETVAISYCSALPITFESESYLVGYFKNELCLFNSTDGKLVARTTVSHDYDEHSASPVYREPYLWAAGPFRAGSKLFRLEKSDEKVRLVLVYQTTHMSNDVAPTVLINDHLYGFDLRDVQSKVHRPSRGQFACMDFLTGEIRWKNGTLGRRSMTSEAQVTSSDTTLGDNEIGHASSVAVGNQLVLFNDRGELLLATVDEEKLTLHGRANILGGEICWAPPSVINGCVLIRNHTKAACVYLGNSNELEKSRIDFEFAADIPQSHYIDWASILLGTEPKFAMTSPSVDWLTQWFIVSLVGGWVMVPVIAYCVTVKSLHWRRTVFVVLVGVFGMVGTTVIGHLGEAFSFTWPVLLAIFFEQLVCQMKPVEKLKRWATWKRRLMLYLFLVVCVFYFWLCRRLSLAFEWSFLLGFPAALPFCLLCKKRVQREERFGWQQWFLSLLAFSAFYWAGAGVMIWKYAF